MHTIKKNKKTGQFQKVYHCDSCQMLSINGIPTHETGCPDAWQDYQRECKWCGSIFQPEEKHQTCCCDDCAEAYFN